MSLQIIRQDITKINCDAIVNSTNTNLLPRGNGVDASIHKAAGPELYFECRKIGGVELGKAVYTKAYKLPCKYVIHTVGPKWDGGNDQELQKLKECYISSLTVAKSLKCENVAVPLISSGVNGVPKDHVLSVAVDVISHFLMDNEMNVILAIYDKSSYELNRNLSSGINKFIESCLYNDNQRRYDVRFRNANTFARESKAPAKRNKRPESVQEEELLYGACESMALCKEVSNLDDQIINIDESFSKRLFKLIDNSGMNDVECYKKANVSRQTWHKIVSDDNYHPSKNTVISLAIALKLSYNQTNRLLASVGYTLSDSILFDVIIKYFLINSKYDIFEIDSTLLKYDQVTLGSST
ncbi:MAG: macro domain-containing protein [Clostridiales bacterium]|nr:macro domain-containing protein [Clostridiales bacterium]